MAFAIYFIMAIGKELSPGTWILQGFPQSAEPGPRVQGLLSSGPSLNKHRRAVGGDAPTVKGGSNWLEFSIFPVPPNLVVFCYESHPKLTVIL